MDKPVQELLSMKRCNHYQCKFYMVLLHQVFKRRRKEKCDISAVSLHGFYSELNAG
jgi:hypothetical protein